MFTILKETRLMLFMLYISEALAIKLVVLVVIVVVEVVDVVVIGVVVVTVLVTSLFESDLIFQ